MFVFLFLLGAAAAGVAVAFAHSRRAGFIVLGGLAGLFALLLLVRIPHSDKVLVVLTLGLFLPLGIVMLASRLGKGQTRPRARRPGPAPPPARRAGLAPVPVLEPAPLHQCPDCGADLPANAPEGLCPRCLLGSGLAGPSATPPPAGPRGTTPYPGPFEAPDPAELAPHFPQLEILGLIGQGGMGAVYKARHIKLDRFVALKVLPPGLGADPAFAERFTREARTLARLNHLNVVAVYDFGESGGLYYLVMEYVDGPNLREVLQAGRLPPGQALAVVPQICDALQYAHDEGVVHRDIKPENILLDGRGRVKIADFGLAKLLNRSRAEFTLTGSRQVMGTLDYMAPEQRQSPLEIDHRADIYSLGVVFYEMLTGELPLGRFAPPSVKAGVDARLDEVVFRALETDPGQRYQSVSAIKIDVESVTGDRAPAGASPVERPDGRGLILTTALHQVRAPATGLMLTGAVAVVLGLVPFVVMTVLYLELYRPRIGPERVPPPGPEIVLLPCLLLFEVLLGSILIAGGLKMRKCESYELAVIAAIIALLPLTGLAFPLSLPMGIWTLVVLGKRSVRAGFGLNLPGSGVGGQAAGQLSKPSGPARGRVRSFVESVLAVFVTRPGKGYPAEEDRRPVG
jgi:predicted Ser/Thr protein kinase